MSCEIYTTAEFERSLKKLSKRYASMKEDYIRFLSELKDNPLMGTEIKYGLRKVRMAIASKQKGKRGGARVITHTVIYNTTDADVRQVGPRKHHRQRIESTAEEQRTLSLINHFKWDNPMMCLYISADVKARQF